MVCDDRKRESSVDEKDNGSPQDSAEVSLATADKTRPVQFGLNSLFVLAVMVALICGWVVDRNKLQRQLDADLVIFRQCRSTLALRLMAEGKGNPVSKYPDLSFLANDVREVDDDIANRLKSEQSPPGKNCIAYYVDRRVDPNKSSPEGECYAIIVYAVDNVIVSIQELSDEW